MFCAEAVNDAENAIAATAAAIKFLRKVMVVSFSSGWW
jgi:hypothetical protein